MIEHPEEHNQDEKTPPPERPLECGECKKPISVLYTSIIGGTMTQTTMCADCPELQRRLFSGHVHQITTSHTDSTTVLACGNCGTTLDALRVGTPLGCSTCYEVFNDVLIGELLAAKRIPPRITPNKKSIPIHIGRSPGESIEMNPSLRLLALNEALNETIKSEDYEQAAWLRDQIKALTENPEKADDDKK